VQEVLVDRGQFILQLGVEILDNFLVALHDLSLVGTSIFQQQ
jgi:hypothetical protein